MAGTPVLLVSLLLSPYVLFSANSRHVPTNNEGPMPIRVLRSLKEKYKDILSTIESLRRTDGSTNVETTFIVDCVGLEDDMNSMKTELETHKSKCKELDKANFDLNKKLRDEIATNRKTGLETALRIAEMQLKLTGLADKMGSKTLKISKLTLQFLSKYLEYKDQETKTEKAKDSKIKSDLEKKLKEKKKELSLAEQELLAAGVSSDVVIQVVTLQEKIRELESKEADEDVLKQIAELKSQLRKKQEELKKSGDSDDSSVLLPEIFESQDEILKMYIKIQALTDKSESNLRELQAQLIEKNRQLKKLRESSDPSASADIAKLERQVRTLEGKMEDVRKDRALKINELEKAIKEKQSLLQDNIKDFQDNHGTDLILKVMTQQLRLQETQSAVCSKQIDTGNQLEEIKRQLATKEKEIQSLEGLNKRFQKELKEKSEEFSDVSNQLKAAEKELKEKSEKLAAAEGDIKKQKLMVQEKTEENTRLKDKITALEKSKAEMEDSCESLKQRYRDLKTQFEEDMNQIEGVPKLIIKINMLNSEIETLKRGIDRGSEDKTELLKKLEAKKKELEEAETDLRERSPSSKSIKELITVIKERVTEDSDNIQDYLKKISDLEKELEERIAKLGETETENVQAMIKVLAQQDEITQLKNKLAKVKMATSQKIAEKEAELEKKTQEIIKIKADNCGSDKKKEEIAVLEREARELDAEIKRLKESSQKDIADLEKRLKEKEKDLKASTEKLQSVDKEKGALILKTMKMQGEMDALKNGEKNLKQRAANEIADLKSQVQEKEQEIAKLNKDLTNSAEEAKACTGLKKTNKDLEEALSKKDKDLNNLLKEKDEALSSQKEAEDGLEKLKKASAALEEEKNNLQESLDRKEKQNQSLKEQVEDLEKKNKDMEEKAINVVQPAIDPDTAHPGLQLSNGNTEMRLLKTPLNVSDNPTRYNYIKGALASTGFDQGRQYWEIGVAEKNCYVLGVAAETAVRNGNIQLKPKNQYWTLMLSRNNILSAYVTKRTVLIEAGKAKPKIIGVLIDFKKKEISFFDSGTRSHLYTFTNIEVKSKLFPFLSTCEDTDQGSPPMVLKKGVSADWLKS